MAKRFYRTVVQVEILSESYGGEEPSFEGVSLTDIDYEIKEGECSGIVKVISTENVAPAEMARLLLDQGSDPSFFKLDNNGHDAD